MSDKQSSEVIGIDFGTRNSCVSTWRNKKLEIICDNYGNHTLPSVVSFLNNAKLVGSNALVLKEVSAENTIYDIKRLIGKKITDDSIDQIKNLLSYKISSDDNNNILIHTSNTKKKYYRPVEICSFILKEIKSMSDKHFNKPVSKAVITVPAYFNDFQRQAILDAAKIAELNVLKIINEPTAAAIAYGLGDKKWNNETGGTIVVYDFGAGTLDVSLMNISNGVFRTLAVGGNSNLGGEDIDNLLINFVINKFKKQNNLKDVILSKLSFLKLKNSVENVKKILSISKKATVIVDNFIDNLRLCVILTRNELENTCVNLFNMCIKPLSDVLESANLSKHDIDEVILVGGSTKIPKIRKLILTFFKDTQIQHLTKTLNPDEVVSAGASMYGYIMTNNDDPFTSNVVLLDITPLSLGVETLQKKMTTIIPRNTVIPTSRVKMFTTDSDYQDSVVIKIFEGERKLTRDNYHIDTIELCGFERGPRGYPTIKITFKIDINGMLHVTASEKKSKVENSIIINSTYGNCRLSSAEITQLIEEAKENENLDLIYSKKIELIHNIRSTCNAITININDAEYNIKPKEKNKILNEINNILSWLDKHNSYDIDTLVQKEEYLQKKYLPMIICTNKKNDQFVDTTTQSNAANIYGDDEDDVEINSNFRIDIEDKYDSNNDNIKEFKKIIINIGDQILDIVNLPSCNICENDREFLRDYINSVFIWIYTTSSTSSKDFSCKIDEMNKTTEEIINNYNDIFTNNQTNYYEELKSLCLTLKNYINSNHFSLRHDEKHELEQLIDKTIIWLNSNDNQPDNVYLDKINTINMYCNSLYENLVDNSNNTESYIDNNDNDEYMTESDHNSQTSSDSETKDNSNKIVENINSLLINLPDKPLNDKSILLKVDINKLNTKKSLKYKS